MEYRANFREVHTMIRLSSSVLAKSLLTAVMLLTLGTALAAERGEAVVHPQSWPAVTPAIPLDSKTEAFVSDLLAKMTLEEKVGQLIQADISAIRPEDLHRYKLGSILAGGNSAPAGEIRATPEHWLALADEFYRASVADSTAAHPAIPELFGIDAVHGHSRIPGATVFPHNVGLGATHDPALIEKIGRAAGEEVAATGLDWTFAPTVAVVRDVRWGRSYESFSEDPTLVASCARAMVLGLQGVPGTAEYLGAGHTLASVKHFLGDGGTVGGRDQFDNLIDETGLRSVHAPGYQAAIGAGALNVMASYNGWQGTKMHAQKALLTEVLKGRWNFSGFVVGDWNAQEEIPGCTKYNCPEVLNAGVDMYMAPDSWRQLYDNLLAQVRAGTISQARVDDAVRRVLRVKAMMGLFTKGSPRSRADAGHFEQLGSAAHRSIARAAVRKSMVLLKNNGGVLPLDPRGHILVTGAGADNIGMQSGGWTIDWQGDHNTNADFPGGTSIYAGIKTAVEGAGGKATLSTDGLYQERPSAAIVVFGESPYAEFEGDRETLQFSPTDRTHMKILNRLHAAGIPVVSIFISGRPMWVNPELNASDAFVAAWLPGSEGGGIADVLFRRADGKSSNPFSGRLGFSWPATAMPVGFDKSGAVTGALFKRGYGLSGSEHAAISLLSEDPKLSPAQRETDTLFYGGHVTAPWSIYVHDSVGEVRLTMRSQPSPGGGVTVRLEPPAARAVWSGNGPAELRIGGRATDLRAAIRENAALVMRYRLAAHPTQQVRIGLRCEGPYRAPDEKNADGTPHDWSFCGTRTGASVDITKMLSRAPLGAWERLEIPLRCLAGDPADVSLVNGQFALDTAGAFDVSFTDVRFAAAAENAACP
jgi:beta-glucosidase